MNKDLEEVIKLYTLKGHKALTTNLLGRSKGTAISLFISLLTIYFNDKNSSTLREYICSERFRPQREKDRI